MASICVVTGAGRGLGKLIAGRLAGRGHAVACTDIDRAAAEATAAAIGGGAWAIHHDVRDPAAHQRVAAEAAARGRVGVWVNNAGVLSLGPAWDQTEADVRRMVEVNLLGVIWGSQAAVGAMRDAGGVIVNVSSLSALTPVPGLAVYAATKHAVLGFSTSLQGDLDRAHVRIRVATVCPDSMETDMVKRVAHDDGADLFYSAGERMLRPEEVADAVLELAHAARPRLVTVLPRSRAVIAHAFRAFPGLELKIVEQFARLGRKVRVRRGLA